MSDFSRWLTEYFSNQDDGTLETWSSRKMVAKAHAELARADVTLTVEVADDVVVVSGMGATVEIDRGGLPASRCDCPAPRACKHRVIAALELRQRSEGSTASDDGSSVLESVDEAQARAAFGAPLWRKARRTVAEGARVSVEARRVWHVELVGLGVRCTFPAAADLRASLCSCKRAFPCIHRAVAVAGYLAEHRSVEAEPAGRSHSLEWTRDALLAECMGLLERVVSVGLEHTTELWRRRALRLAVGAHTLGFAQLESELERLTRELAGPRTMDLPRAVEACARSYLLARRLTERTDVATTGTFRRTYVDVGSMELACIGASPTISARGDVGVVLYFHDGETILTHAMFIENRRTRMAAVDPWRRRRRRGELWGVGGWHDFVGRRIHLQHARRSVDGRLSGSSDTRAVLLEEVDVTELAGIETWTELVAPALRPFSLDALDPPSLVLLGPTEVGEAGWDPSDSALVFDLVDSGGRRLAARVPRRPDPDSRVADLADGLGRGTPRWVLGRIFARGTSLSIEPVALLFERAETRAFHCLGLSDRPPTPLRLEGLPVARSPAGEGSHPVARTRRWVVDAFLGGRARLTDAQRSRAAAICADLQAAGLPTLAAHLSAAVHRPDALIGCWAAGRLAADVVQEEAIRRSYGVLSR